MLDVADLEVGYGKDTVLHGASMTVGSAEIVALVGQNGAGKSTLLKALAGTLKIRSGSVHIDGDEITDASTRERVALGMRLVPQQNVVFDDLTVVENLRVAGHRLGRDEVERRIDVMLSEVADLSDRRRQRAGHLSGGERRALGVAIGLMTSPKLLMLDEPSAGLAPTIVGQLISSLETVNESLGTAILLVEQNVREALSIAHRAYIGRQGALVEIPGPPFSISAVVDSL